MQRLRVRFERGAELKFISHLDIMRLWQRALLRAGLELAYSEGFSPHPRISLAAPLALGVTSRAELMDIFLSRWVSPDSFTGVVSRQLPPGIKILQAHQLAPVLPALQAQVRFAEYEVVLETENTRPEVESAINTLLEREHLPWEHQRDTGPHRYDLRELIEDVWLLDWHPGGCRLGMRLRCDNHGSGRPEQVAAALGFAGPPAAVERTRLILEAS